jgi:hypothetical protein
MNPMNNSIPRKATTAPINPTTGEKIAMGTSPAFV